MGTLTIKKAPTAAELLADAKSRKQKDIETARDTAIEGGFLYEFSGTQDRVQTRQRDRENLMGLAVAAQQAITAGASQAFQFRAESNETYTLTPDEMLAVSTAAQEHVSAQYAHSWSLKAQIDAAKSQAELDSIAW